MLIPLEVVAAIIAAFGSGFSIGFWVGKSYKPTVTEYPHEVCHEMKRLVPKYEDWEHTRLILHNGKVKTVHCKWIIKKKCTLTAHKCRFLL